MIGKDKRRAERTPHDSVFEILDAAGKLIESVSHLTDVSAVGARFSSTLRFSKGDRVRARLYLLRTGVLEITGRVVRVKEENNLTFYSVEFETVKGVKP